ncbi:MAG: caspase family protein [Parachlamydiaceae bacterium]
MKINSKILSLIVVLLSFIGYNEASTFHIILVGDTLSDLREQTVSDLNLMHEQSVQLAHVLGASPRLHVIQEHLVSREVILGAIERLSVQTDDYVLFYYSGHGCRTEEKESPWPYLHFTPSNQYVALDELIEHLRKKPAKFGLVVADCCNNNASLEDEFPDTSLFDFQTLDRRNISPYAQQLFARSKGWLVISGAEPGGYSWASDDGGILTCAFMDGLSYAQYSPSKNWPDLMDEIKYKTVGIQKPQFTFLP